MTTSTPTSDRFSDAQINAARGLLVIRKRLHEPVSEQVRTIAALPTTGEQRALAS